MEVCFSKQPCRPMCTASVWHVHAAQVNAEAQKIGKEADEANAIAAECQAGLDKALPALQAAEDALNVLTKKDMSELKVQLPEILHLGTCHLTGSQVAFDRVGSLPPKETVGQQQPHLASESRHVGSHLCGSALQLGNCSRSCVLGLSTRQPLLAATSQQLQHLLQALSSPPLSSSSCCLA